MHAAAAAHVVTHPGLSVNARVVGVWIVLHTLRPGDWEALDGEAMEADLGVSLRTRQRAVKEVEDAGLIIRRRVGRADYEVCWGPALDPFRGLSPAILGRHLRGVGDSRTTSQGSREIPGRHLRGVEDSASHPPDSPQVSSDPVNPPTRLPSDDVRGGGGDLGRMVVGSRGITPPIVPPGEAEYCLMDERAEEALADDAFDNFRSALRDYLTDRVPPDRHWGYVMTVRTWLEGGAGCPRGLFQLPKDERGLAFASALNELLQLSAEEEAFDMKSARGRAGMTAALRSKMEYLIRRGRDAHGATEHQRGTRTRTEAGTASSAIGGNQPAFPEDVGR